MSDSFLIQPDGGELFDGPKVITAKDFAAIHFSAGQHTITLTSERPFLVTVTPTSETSE
jgi:hypothetical protein